MIQNNNISVEKFQEIIAELGNCSNKELTQAMDFLNFDFNETKTMILELTSHLDNIESLYNNVLTEYEQRTNGK
jgi:flagellin-specific chaperone FliS